MPEQDLKLLIHELSNRYPDISFIEGQDFYWSPKDRSVTYVSISTQPNIATWSLLHEVSHGILGHTKYNSDFELIQLESKAWQYAKKIGKEYGIKIDPEHIQDCLDTYRDWLYRRSCCPECGNVSTQQNSRTYKCFNCKTAWHVSNSRFCRPYRQTAKLKKAP